MNPFEPNCSRYPSPRRSIGSNQATLIATIVLAAFLLFCKGSTGLTEDSIVFALLFTSIAISLFFSSRSIRLLVTIIAFANSAVHFSHRVVYWEMFTDILRFDTMNITLLAVFTGGTIVFSLIAIAAIVKNFFGSWKA